MAYAGVNRPDALAARRCLYNPPPTASDLPGLEASGEVVSVGPGVDRDRHRATMVCALLPGGGYAEYVATPAGALPARAGAAWA